MQIDGHHTLTYVVARYAGMDHSQAEKLAYCAQYVDEATNSDPVHFDNGAMYSRVASAHKMLDYRNASDLANHLVWIPFHFLPGNQGLESTKVPDGGFVQRLVCTPDSHVARDMLRMVAQYRQTPFALHMMGIAMHVYADTFAHQGFAGISHEINVVDELTSEDCDAGLFSRVKKSMLRWSISSISPLGHGPALIFPDLPYQSWNYVDGNGNKVERNNTEDFLLAANQMYRAIKCFLNEDSSMDLEKQEDLSEERIKCLRSILEEIKDDDGEKRHKEWLTRISDGFFDFGPDKLTFETCGKDSWKEIARGKAVASPFSNGASIYKFSDSFLTSDWKYFHDALKTYRLAIIRDVLPKYDICVA
ncbi:hypothetical protein VHA01S_008_00440 [Vibrio halioticoli NBRC 102217]|uniref:Uncharacterized protein n=1 Tax=Vibrio halioticoli NBRC 102217 TaxID=1219072 RepID=V5FBH9_9VIBR|nr:DUF6765 family protein [Vibrio halioticoli]GAD88648.1 hypothetical protein VHA01S_008_00440 [Vibrio halioticoli NBRC 102217]